MPSRRGKGRKQFAIDLWATKDTDCDPELTLYSDDKADLILKAQSLRVLMFPDGEALFFNRTEQTPDWDTVEHKFWSEPEPVPPIISV